MPEQANDDQRDLSYLHCPFLDPAAYTQADAALVVEAPAPRPPVLRRQPVAALSPRDEAALATWAPRGFTETERDAWLAAGLSRYEAHLAEQCVAAGITVADLYRTVDGRTVKHWIRSGEAVGSVRARILNATA